MEDGTRYSARKGSAVTVSDEHASAVQRYSGGDAAILNGSGRSFLGTRTGRWCTACRRLWQAWSKACPRCGEATIAEADMPPAPQCDTLPGCC